MPYLKLVVNTEETCNMKTIIQLLTRFVPRKILQPLAQFGSKIISVFYLGNKFYCIVCNRNFRKLLPYGRLKSRENALCPNCLSLERHRLMWYYLKKNTKFFTKKLKVLHFAPEICFVNRFKKLSNLNYITADLESPWAMVKMDIHNIKFPDNKFDVVFCNHVLEHVDNDLKAMSEIYRVLKPNGWAIIQSPQDWNLETTYEDKSITEPLEREKHFGQADHLRMYGRDYGKRLSSVGFIVEENKLVYNLEKKIIIKNCFSANEVIYLCKKL